MNKKIIKLKYFVGGIKCIRPLFGGENVLQNNIRSSLQYYCSSLQQIFTTTRKSIDGQTSCLGQKQTGILFDLGLVTDSFVKRCTVFLRQDIIGERGDIRKFISLFLKFYNNFYRRSNIVVYHHFGCIFQSIGHCLISLYPQDIVYIHFFLF